MPTAETLPTIAQAMRHGARRAVLERGAEASYAELLAASERVARALLEGRADLAEARVAILMQPGAGWIAALWGVWRAGGVAAPLPLAAAGPELEFLVRDTGAEILLHDAPLAPFARPLAESLGLRALDCGALGERPKRPLPRVAHDRRAMILYTSGTTSRPKGVVTTHETIAAQIETLVRAWEWRATDRIPLFLPLHHLHGIVNVLGCALWSGALCEVAPRFDARWVWARIASGELTLLMAVPTIYYRLIESFDQAPLERQRAMRCGCAAMRLMVSGSAALPVSILERWREISGHTLLERYGMTEIGMALSNPLRGERRPGCVGQPLPGVEARLVDERGEEIAGEAPGEIEVRGPCLFREYWGRPEATREAFRPGGWFRTGDMAVIDRGAYRILGRASVDILKSGGHKISALEVEETLREHPAIAECAVVGAPDAEWGERVAAAVVLRPGSALDLQALREWGGERIAPWKLPTRLLTLERLPRNAMGKTVKPSIIRLFAN